MPTDLHESLLELDAEHVSCCAANRLEAEVNPLCGVCVDGMSEWGGKCVPSKRPSVGRIFFYRFMWDKRRNGSGGHGFLQEAVQLSRLSCCSTGTPREARDHFRRVRARAGRDAGDHQRGV